MSDERGVTNQSQHHRSSGRARHQDRPVKLRAALDRSSRSSAGIGASRRTAVTAPALVWLPLAEYYSSVPKSRS